jgi:hypothetical protein
MAATTSLRATAALAVLLAAAGCKATGGKDANADSAATDTAGSAAVGGLTDAQIQQEAKPVTPEEARAMGIADSATLPGSENEVSDSTGSPAATSAPGTPAAAAPADSAHAAATAAPRPAAPATRKP